VTKHKAIFLVIATSFLMSSATITAFSSKAKFPDHYENQKWDASKPPVVDEPAVNLELANAAWQSATKQACEGPRSWVSNSNGRLEASGVKEHNVEVRGGFHHFTICLKPEAENGVAHGRGWIDLSSWDSGLAARDRRVTRYVFGVEHPDQSMATFDFTIDHWRLPQPPVVEGQPQPLDTWDATMKANIGFRGMQYTIETPTTVSTQGGNSVKLTTPKPLEFHFMQPVVEKGFEQMMALCNHHFLASYALVAFDLQLVPTEAAPKPSGRGKAKAPAKPVKQP
jgi:hypothetical protein